jgi:hypothetical protein
MEYSSGKLHTPSRRVSLFAHTNRGDDHICFFSDLRSFVNDPSDEEGERFLPGMLMSPSQIVLPWVKTFAKNRQEWLFHDLNQEENVASFLFFDWTNQWLFVFPQSDMPTQLGLHTGITSTVVIVVALGDDFSRSNRCHWTDMQLRYGSIRNRSNPSLSG